MRTATVQDVIGLATSSSSTVNLSLSARQAATAVGRMACSIATSGRAAVQPVRRGRTRQRLRLCGTSLSREAVTVDSAALRHSTTSCRAPPPPGRRITKRTVHPTGSTGTLTVTATAATGRQPDGMLTPRRPARPRPATSMGTETATSMRTSPLPTRPHLHKVSPRGDNGAARPGRTRT